MKILLPHLKLKLNYEEIKKTLKDEIKNSLIEQTKIAKSGIFGAPSFIVGRNILGG